MRIIILFITFISLYAKTVIVTGFGQTPEQAKKDALRQAVEAVVGADLKSTTIVKNGKLDYDKMISNTDGLIKSYEELEKYKTNGYWSVKLKVDVDKNTIKDISQFINNRRAMRSAQDTCFKNRSVLVMYQKIGTNALNKNTMAVTDLLNTVEDILRDKEFDIILPEDLPGMAKKDTFSDDEIFELGSKASADAIVVATINADKIKGDGGYNIIIAKIALKAYDPTSRRLFANVIKRGKVVALNSKFGILDGAARVAAKIAKEASIQLVKKIIKRMCIGSKQWIVITFKKANEDIQDEILDTFDDLGYTYKVVFETSNYLKLKVSANMSGTAFRRVIKKHLRKKDIKLKTLKTQGDMINFEIKGGL